MDGSHALHPGIAAAFVKPGSGYEPDEIDRRFMRAVERILDLLEHE